MKYIVVLLCFISALSACAQPEKAENFREQLGKDIEKDQLGGNIAIGLMKNNQPLWRSVAGQAPEGNLYRIGSISKIFTAVILLQLADEGKLSLDDKLEKYVPEIAQVQNYSGAYAMTLRQLASHTSGLNREPGLKAASEGPVSEWENKLLAAIPSASFASEPDQHFLYSNIGFALLGLALERAAATPFISLVQDRIFTPLKMDSSYFVLPANMLPAMVKGIDNQNGNKANRALPLRELSGRGYRVPNGGIITCIGDLQKFAVYLMNTPRLLKRMEQTPVVSKHYGLGLMVRDDGFVGHDGSTPGYTSILLMRPEKGDAVILLRNYNTGETKLGDAAAEGLNVIRKWK